MPWRPCLRCGELVEPPASYCPEHEPVRESRRTPGRGGGARASRFRAAVLRRAGYRCEVVEHGQRCPVDDPAQLEAHHVRAIVDGGDADDPDNGRAVCRHHHRIVEGLHEQ